MLKEPAEPENTQRQKKEEKERHADRRRRIRRKGIVTGKKRGTEKGVKMKSCISTKALNGLV